MYLYFWWTYEKRNERSVDISRGLDTSNAIDLHFSPSFLPTARCIPESPWRRVRIVSTWSISITSSSPPFFCAGLCSWLRCNGFGNEESPCVASSANEASRMVDSGSDPYANQPKKKRERERVISEWLQYIDDIHMRREADTGRDQQDERDTVFFVDGLSGTHISNPMRWSKLSNSIYTYRQYGWIVCSNEYLFIHTSKKPSKRRTISIEAETQAQTHKANTRKKNRYSTTTTRAI